MRKQVCLNQETKIIEEKLYSDSPEWLPVNLDAIDTTILSQLKLDNCQLTLVCGVSTAGKNTLVQAILNSHPKYKYLPRATSRPPRLREKDGVDYFFNLDKPLIWSEYGNYVYAITQEVLEKLAQQKRSIQIQGLLYGFVLKKILAPYGVKVKIIYLVPELMTKNMLGSLRVILERLFQIHPNQVDARLPSIVRELKFIFSYQNELKARGIKFLENPPARTVPHPLAVKKFLKLLEQ